MAAVTVLGAGVIGLSTAVAIQRLMPSAQVTIVADKFVLDTTSAGAAGILCPSNLGVSDEMQR